MMRRLLSIFTLALLCTTSLAAESTTLSILYFQNTRGEKQHDWLRKGITDMLIGDAGRSPALNVVEREDLQNVLKEQALAQSGILEDGQALELGRLLRAKLIVSGSYIVSGGVLRIEAKLTDVQSGTVVDTARAEGKLADIFAVQRRLTVDLFRALKVAVPPGLNPQGDPPTESVEAVEHYYEGLDLFDQGDIQAAKDKFETASRLDPVYDKPASGLAEAYKLLSDIKRLRRQQDLHRLTERITLLRRRMNDKPFVTAEEFAREIYSREDLTIEDKHRLARDGMTYYALCASPADCTSRAFDTMLDLGDFFGREFEDPKTAADVYRRVAVGAREAAANTPATDPKRAEIAVRELEALYKLEHYEDIQQRVSDFLKQHSDSGELDRVEGIYERSVEALENIREEFEEMEQERKKEDYRALEFGAAAFLRFYKYRPERKRAEEYVTLAREKLREGR